MAVESDNGSNYYLNAGMEQKWLDGLITHKTSLAVSDPATNLSLMKWYHTSFGNLFQSIVTTMRDQWKCNPNGKGVDC